MSAPLPPGVLAALETGFANLVANKSHVLASTVMLLYDHLLTFEQERVYIWNREKSLPSYLFLVFRYATPVVSLINLVALNSPSWTGSICNNWIWLPVAIGPIISATTGVILKRTSPQYDVVPANVVLYITVPVYLAQLGVMGWAIPAGIPAPLPPGFVGCVPSSKPGTGFRLSSIYIVALAFDATIFLLTLGRAVYMTMTKSTVPLVTLIVCDGTLYFAVLFVVHVINVLMLALAPPDLSAINAPFATMITALLVARLVLNLCEAGDQYQLNSQNTHVNTSATLSWSSPDRSHHQPQEISKLSKGRTTKGWALGTRTFDEILGLDEFDVLLGWVEDEHVVELEGSRSNEPHPQPMADAFEMRELSVIPESPSGPHSVV